MSIFKKGVESPKKEISVVDYYGNIEIDLLDDNDKIIKLSDFTSSDISIMFTRYSFELPTKNQFNDADGGKFLGKKGSDYFEISLSDCFLLAPVLKFEKPLKEIFKYTQNDEKGRDIVYFSKYPTEDVSGKEKENIIAEGKENGKKIHFSFRIYDIYGNCSDYIYSEYPVVSYNDAEYTVISKSALDDVLKLKPIKWLCDYENNRLVCLDGLIGGISNNIINEELDFNKSTVYNFFKNYLLPDIMQFVEVPKLEEDKNKSKDNILNMLRELLNKTKFIKDMNDKILIVEDIKVLANLYGKEMLKIKNHEPSVYGSTERELIRNGILPYYVYIEGEINREVKEDNKKKENKEIEEVINKLKERASLINDEEIKNEILLQIEELNQDYLNALFKGKTSYQRIDFTKPLEEVKTNTGEVKLTFIPPRPVLIKELVEREIAISKRIDREINNNNFRNELFDFEEFANKVVKR